MTTQTNTAAMTGLFPAANRQSFVKLDPRILWRNPVMFVTAVVAATTTILGPRDLAAGNDGAWTARPKPSRPR